MILNFLAVVVRAGFEAKTHFYADGEAGVLRHSGVGEGARCYAGDGDMAYGAVAGGIFGGEHGDAGDLVGCVGLKKMHAKCHLHERGS